MYWFGSCKDWTDVADDGGNCLILIIWICNIRRGREGSLPNHILPSTCKNKAAIALNSVGNNKVLFSLNISITRKIINKEICFLETGFYEENILTQ